MARGECFAAFRSASRIDFGRPPADRHLPAA